MNQNTQIPEGLQQKLLMLIDLSHAKTVKEWNRIRNRIKSQVTTEEWMKYFLPAIDASGLIVTILGKDPKRNQLVTDKA